MLILGTLVVKILSVHHCQIQNEVRPVTAVQNDFSDMFAEADQISEQLIAQLLHPLEADVAPRPEELVVELYLELSSHTFSEHFGVQRHL